MSTRLQLLASSLSDGPAAAANRQQWENQLSPLIYQRSESFLDGLYELGQEATSPDDVQMGPLIDTYHGSVVAGLREDVIDSGERIADAVYYSALEEEFAEDGINALLAVLAAGAVIGASRRERTALLDVTFRGPEAAPTSAGMLSRWVAGISGGAAAVGLTGAAITAASPYLAGPGAVLSGTVLSAPGAVVRTAAPGATVIPGEVVGRGKQLLSWVAKLDSKSTAVATTSYNSVVEQELRGAGAWPYKRWYSRLDGNVRATHQEAHGQTVPMGATFEVGGNAMSMPGDTRAPMEEWLNCRCVAFGARSRN